VALRHAERIAAGDVLHLPDPGGSVGRGGDDARPVGAERGAPDSATVALAHQVAAAGVPHLQGSVVTDGDDARSLPTIRYFVYKREQTPMLKLILSIRYMGLFTSVGAAVGALLMFWVGGAQLITALAMLSLDQENVKTIIAAVMSATDAFLFAAVLILFAYAIAFIFVLQASPEYRHQLPGWMQVEGVGELKRILIEAILVYLVVDFATDLAAEKGHVSWETLVIPLSILLIAGASRLVTRLHPET
jgi:uncharacterized membrane protein YqhA